jgi:deoxyribodipyrimidine photo-lyase
MYKNSMSTSPILKKAKIAASATSSSIALFWFRSDLRLADNTALAHCLRNSSTSKTPVVALYLLSQDEWLMHDIAPVKIDLILRSLQILRKDLKEKMGIPLVVVTVPSVLTASEPRDESKRPFVGQAASSVASFCQQWNVTSLFANKEYEVDEKRRDEMVKIKLLDLGISATFLDDQCVVEPGKVC